MFLLSVCTHYTHMKLNVRIRSVQWSQMLVYVLVWRCQDSWALRSTTESPSLGAVP